MSIKTRLALLALISVLILAAVTYWTVCLGPDQGTSLALRQFDTGPGPAAALRIYTAGSGQVAALAAAFEIAAALLLLWPLLYPLWRKPATKSIQ